MLVKLDHLPTIKNNFQLTTRRYWKNIQLMSQQFNLQPLDRNPNLFT